LVLAGLTAWAAPSLAQVTYYVCSSGNDANPGTLAAPFATLQCAVTHLTPGSTLYVRQGTYYGPVSIAQSGTSTAPISITAYPGECPLLDGASPVTGTWSNYSGSIYKAPWPSQPAQVFCGGLMLNEARWPPAPVEGLSAQTVAISDSGSTSQMTCAALPAGVDLNNALIQIMPGQSWCSYTRTVAEPGPGTLVFSTPVVDASVPAISPRRGDRFYVFGKLNLLTTASEWYWDPTALALYIWTPDGNAPESSQADMVEAGPATCVLVLDNQSYVVVNGISAIGGWFSLHNSSYCTVQNCHLREATWTRQTNGYATLPAKLGGGDITGTGNQWLGGSVVNSGRIGVNIQGGSGHLIQGVSVFDSGWNWANDGGIEVDNATQSTVQYCTIDRTARAGIFDYSSSACNFLYNIVSDPALYSEDIGCFDSWGTNGQGTTIAYNVFENNHTIWGAGLYLDDNALNFVCHDNVIQNTNWFGIITKQVNYIYNNTVLNAGHNAIYVDSPVTTNLAGATIANNLVTETFPVQASVNQASVADYGYYCGFAYLATPGRVELDFSQITQPWWANMVPFDPTVITGFTFSVPDWAVTFNYTIANLRLLPTGQAGDTGAVTIEPNLYWSAYAGTDQTGGTPAVSTLNPVGPPVWGCVGNNPLFGNNSITGGVEGTGVTNLSAYRGIAFEISGGATISYAISSQVDLNNGPSAPGASSPASQGAPAGQAATVCVETAPTFTYSPTPSVTSTSTPTLTPTVSMTPSANFTASASPTPTMTSFSTPTPTTTPTTTFTSSPTAVPYYPPVVYPNPVTIGGTFNIHLNLGAPSSVKVQFFTTSFRKVLDEALPQIIPGQDIALPLADKNGNSLSNGLYYVVATANGSRNIFKLLVLR
jgi:hypothetical protein